MKSVLRMRHYCDFCKKSTGTKPSMEKHEKSCTANPERVCRMCSFADLEQQPFADLVKANTFEGFEALKKLAQGCPACILAAERATDWEHVPNDRPHSNSEWTFKTAAKAWLDEHRPEPEYGGYCG